MEQVKRRVDGGSKMSNAHVEFMNPRQKTDEATAGENGEDGEGGTDDWVWLTSYSRIPVIANYSFGSFFQYFLSWLQKKKA